MNNRPSINAIINVFKLFRNSHPNLSNCWISYLGLKKRHYSVTVGDIDRSISVVNLLAVGCNDIKREDMLRLLLYATSLE